MVHYFKNAGQRTVLDCASGYAANVDEITYKMLAYLTTPLPADCPSAIRYDMAKYDSELVDRTYAAIFAAHRAGMLYTDTPFDGMERPVTTLCLPSDAPVTALQDNTAPVVLCDTDSIENAQALCRAAQANGAPITVCMTKAGDYACDRLLVPENLYASYKNAAPAVGVRLAYDVKQPTLLDRVIAWADDGAALIDAYPENPEEAAAGAQTVLLKELAKVAKELFLREKEGRPIAFLPFALCERGAKYAADAFFSDACSTCSHRMWCGGMRHTEAACEVKRACADAAILLSLSKK